MFIDKEINNITYDSGGVIRIFQKSNFYKHTNPPGLKKTLNDWRFKKSYIGDAKKKNKINSK